MTDFEMHQEKKAAVVVAVVNNPIFVVDYKILSCLI